MQVNENWQMVKNIFIIKIYKMHFTGFAKLILFPEFIPAVSKRKNKIASNLQRTGIKNAVAAYLPVE